MRKNGREQPDEQQIPMHGRETEHTTTLRIVKKKRQQQRQRQRYFRFEVPQFWGHPVKQWLAKQCNVTRVCGVMARSSKRVKTHGLPQ